MSYYERASSAVLPWNSIDAGIPLTNKIPQQDIDVCLMCPHHADACNHCDGNRKISMPVHNGRGRPAINIDPDVLAEMLKLKMCNSEICTKLGVSRSKLMKEKSKLKKEGVLL